MSANSGQLPSQGILSEAHSKTGDSYFAAVRMNSEDSKEGLMATYGHFNDDDSFTITNPLTPRPWVNVFSNGAYGAIVSQMGGGFSWLGNSQLGRLTRWEQDLAADSYGRWLWVYDAEDDLVYSTTFAPVREPALQEEIIHGLGFTTFRRAFADLRTEQTVFVPEDANAEHWIVRITNESSRARTLTIAGYAEWFLGSQGDWHREFHRLFMSCEARDDRLICWKLRSLEEGSRDVEQNRLYGVMHLSGLGNIEWIADKATFLGRAGRMDRPNALTAETLEPATGRWDDPVGAFRTQVSFQPGETKEFSLTIGAANSRESAEALADESTLETAIRRLESLKQSLKNQCGALKVKSNSEDFDRFVNSWLPYQAVVGRMKARSAYYQQGGAFGFRDQLQDSLVLLDTDPKATLDHLRIHAEAMYEDGRVRHWWHPNTNIYAESHHSDTCLWLAFAVLEYLDETNDLEALQGQYSYLSYATQAPSTTGSLLEHCMRGIQRCLEARSDRGLPLIQGGDWNDGLSHAGIEGKGESVWLAMFLFGILNRFAPILDELGLHLQAQEFRDQAEMVQSAVENYGWDGEWFIAGTSDDGTPFGSARCQEGSLFLNPQVWAVLTGIAGPPRRDQAMSAVKNRLVQPYGALLLAPAYSSVNPYIGYITRYAPGLRENGGVYSHASCWAVRAFQMLGDTKTAWQLFTSMLPSRCLQDPDAYRAEPYVMPGNVDGPDSPHEGAAGWTWYTGAAAWLRRVALHDLLGIKPRRTGLEFPETLADELCPVQLVRHFQGDIFEITLEKGSEPKLFVDGEEWPDRRVPSTGKGKTRSVRAIVI